MKKIFVALFFLAATAFAEGNNLIGDNVAVQTTGTGYGKIAIITQAAEPIEFYINNAYSGGLLSTGAWSFPYGITLPNNVYLTATDVGGGGTLSILKGDNFDDTVLNCEGGELIKLSENNTPAITIDPSTNGFTFASLAELGSNSVTDGIDAAYFSSGTAKAKIAYSGNNLQFQTTTAHNIYLGINTVDEAILTGTTFCPNVDGGNALGQTANGWLGLYLSDGTDKWSLVPGVNRLDLTAGANDQKVCISGGSTCDSAANGSWIMLGGVSNAASVYVAGATDKAIFYQTNGTGVHYFYNGANALWSISTTGNLTQDAAGGNIVMAKADSYIYTGAPVSVDITGLGAIITAVDDGYTQFAGLRSSNDANGSGLHLMKSRGTVANYGTANTIVLINDLLGSVFFQGADGVDFQQAAAIRAAVDATPGAGDMAGRLELLTSADGAATPLIRWTANSTGDLVQNATNGGNIVFGKVLTGVTYNATSMPGLAAIGADSAGAGVVTSFRHFVTGADGAKGIRLPDSTAYYNDWYMVNQAASILKIYPHTGETMNGGAADAPYSCPAWTVCHCVLYGGTAWMCS